MQPADETTFPLSARGLKKQAWARLSGPFSKGGGSCLMPKFQLQFEGAVIKEIPAKDEITVGRKPDNDVVIDNPAVSSHHCRIVLVNDTFFVEDLNSTNGVFLNAKKIVKSGLQHNDVIGIAKHALKFIDERKAGSTVVNAPAKPVAAD